METIETMLISYLNDYFEYESDRNHLQADIESLITDCAKLATEYDPSNSAQKSYREMYRLPDKTVIQVIRYVALNHSIMSYKITKQKPKTWTLKNEA